MHFSKKKNAQLMTVCQSSVCVGMLFNWLDSVVLPPASTKVSSNKPFSNKKSACVETLPSIHEALLALPDNWLTLIHDWERYLEESSSAFTVDEWCAAPSLWMFSQIGAFCTRLQKLRGAVKMNDTPCSHLTNLSSLLFFFLPFVCFDPISMAVEKEM